MQLIVLGMHRSGTSALARALNLMGAYFGPEGVGTGANRENPKGFWERRDVRALNDALLHAASCDWDRVLHWNIDALPAAAHDDFIKRASRLILGMDGFRPWFLKEPRLCLLFPLWRKLLEAPVCLLACRHPLEVASSLNHRNAIPIPVGLALWEAYFLSSLESSRGLPRVWILHDRLMGDPCAEVERLHHWLQVAGVSGLRLPSRREITAFIDPGLHREHKDREDLHAFRDAPQIGMFEALASGSPLDDQIVDLGADARRTLAEYEAGHVDAGSKATNAPRPTEKERLAALERETVQLRERLAALEAATRGRSATS